MTTAKTESLLERNLKVQIQIFKDLADDNTKDSERNKNKFGYDDSYAQWLEGKATAFNKAAYFLEDLLERSK
ncbi:hypothetical protein PU629_06245 [Pullulanibacillus sp. KACC 23026]|uniref:hypothetical protein n=1 Tax=Pullulanibacillus sp. KACC 23026 TaxID=3028315 RepID=UPI0023B00188|nr:hypothetical protein [Pullulanibacillus sp. KACC 23026]WEG13964.1 hypothetical protein PU629_06245 [Pullulanibacillus sp. KACC 23026]